MNYGIFKAKGSDFLGLLPFSDALRCLRFAQSFLFNLVPYRQIFICRKCHLRASPENSFQAFSV